MPAPVQLLLTDDPAAAYHGWIRVDAGRWAVVFSASTAGEVWDVLLPLRLGLHCEKAVIAAGSSPDGRGRR